jgi:hypothetical protein
MPRRTASSDALNTIAFAPLQSVETGESRLQKLPPTQFRSLGGYLDYDDWKDRERFMELDRAINALPPHQREVSRYCHVKHSVGMDTQPDTPETIH